MGSIYNDTNPAFSGPTGGSSLAAFFDNRSDAESAVSRLEDAGVPVARIRLMPGYEAGAKNTGAMSEDRSGFFDALADFFFPDEDRAVYAEGLRRGGFLVQVNDVDDALYETVHDILDDEGSIDMQEKHGAFWRGGADNHPPQREDLVDLDEVDGVLRGLRRSEGFSRVGRRSCRD